MSEPRFVIPDSEKGYQCQMILDSLSPAGVRLVTMRLKYPLIVHAEMCRHRCFSRSVASNRAIPTAKIIAMVEQDPFIPIYWGKNQAGMQAAEELTGCIRRSAESEWLAARDQAVKTAGLLSRMDLHKQIANRVLNPFQWVTEVITGTDWANFFALRCHPAAQPEIRKIAEMARQAYDSHTPHKVGVGEWHLPFVFGGEFDTLGIETLKRISTARVARTSYRTHEGRISSVVEDLALYERLVGSQPIHASPTEHVATPMISGRSSGNFRGWKQHRSEIENHTIQD